MRSPRPDDTEVPADGQNTAAAQSDAGHSSVDGTPLDANGTDDGNGLANHPATNGSETAANPGGDGARDTELELGRLEYIRLRLHDKGVSEDGINTILQGWKRDNGKHHDTPFRRWIHYAKTAGINHEDPAIADVVNFAALILRGTDPALGPSTLNNVKSCLGAVHITYAIASLSTYSLDNVLVLERVRKAARFATASAPKQNFGWTMAQYMGFIREHLSQPDTIDGWRLKTILLLRADLFLRSHDFVGLYRETITQGHDERGHATLAISLYRPKEWQTGQHDWTDPVTVFTPSSMYATVDTVGTVLEYIKRTDESARDTVQMIGGKQFTPLVVSSTPIRDRATGKQRHIALKSQTIASITSKALKPAGILTSEDTPHSTRGVAASHVYMITNDEAEVVKRGRWSSSATFRTYYSKEFAGETLTPLRKVEHLSNIADVLRCTMVIADEPTSSADCDPTPDGEQTATTETPQVEVQASEGSRLLRKRTRPTRVADTLAHIKIGAEVVFARGYWDDMPKVAVRARVLRCVDGVWFMYCHNDGNEIDVSEEDLEDLLETGQLKVVTNG
jgi:hypothetical protein